LILSATTAATASPFPHNLNLTNPPARAKWAQEAAEVLLGVILNPNNSQRSRQAAETGMSLLSQQLDVHISVWLAPVLAAMSPPLMSRRIIPVRVSLQIYLQVFVMVNARTLSMVLRRDCSCLCAVVMSLLSQQLDVHISVWLALCWLQCRHR
jgi:hypothetical protein